MAAIGVSVYEARVTERPRRVTLNVVSAKATAPRLTGLDAAAMITPLCPVKASHPPRVAGAAIARGGEGDDPLDGPSVIREAAMALAPHAWGPRPEVPLAPRRASAGVALLLPRRRHEWVVRLAAPDVAAPSRAIATDPGARALYRPPATLNACGVDVAARVADGRPASRARPIRLGPLTAPELQEALLPDRPTDRDARPSTLPAPVRPRKRRLALAVIAPRRPVVAARVAGRARVAPLRAPEASGGAGVALA